MKRLLIYHCTISLSHLATTETAITTTTTTKKVEIKRTHCDEYHAITYKYTHIYACCMNSIYITSLSLSASLIC